MHRLRLIPIIQCATARSARATDRQGPFPARCRSTLTADWVHVSCKGNSSRDENPPGIVGVALERPLEEVAWHPLHDPAPGTGVPVRSGIDCRRIDFHGLSQVSHGRLVVGFIKVDQADIKIRISVALVQVDGFQKIFFSPV